VALRFALPHADEVVIIIHFLTGIEAGNRWLSSATCCCLSSQLRARRRHGKGLQERRGMTGKQHMCSIQQNL